LVLGPPNNQVGPSTAFDVQVTPITVNFEAVKFRENIPAQMLGNWPDGTPNTWPAAVVYYTVTEDPAGNFNRANDSSAAVVPRSQLNSPPNFVGPPSPFYNYTVSVPGEYKNTAGAWTAANTVVFCTDSKLKSFNTYNLQARTAFSCDTILWGNWMGPWQ